VIVPAIPTGVPVGGVFAKDRTRLLIALDEQGEVVRTECSVASLNSQQLQALGCLDPTKQEHGVRPLPERNLNDLHELKEASFYDGTGGGAHLSMVLSPDGQLLAAVDTNLHVWVIDLERFRVIYDVQAAKPGWVTGGMARVAFSPDSQQLVISQPGNPILVLHRATDHFVEETRIANWEINDIQFAGPDNTSLIGLNADQAIQISTRGSLVAKSEKEGKVFFDAKGLELKKLTTPGPLLSAILDLAWHKPSQRAVFNASGQGLAILDPRNDFARQLGIANFHFSPKGEWLASNNCQYLALWNSRQISETLVGTVSDSSISPELATLIPLTSRDNNTIDECLGPLAFSPTGEQIAAATRDAVYVWHIRPGNPPNVNEPLSFKMIHRDPRPYYRVLAVALTPDQRLVVVTAYYSEISVLSWQLQ
jgi:WD40 repeat protein